MPSGALDVGRGDPLEAAGLHAPTALPGDARRTESGAVEARRRLLRSHLDRAVRWRVEPGRPGRDVSSSPGAVPGPFRASARHRAARTAAGGITGGAPSAPKREVAHASPRGAAAVDRRNGLRCRGSDHPGAPQGRRPQRFRLCRPGLPSSPTPTPTLPRVSRPGGRTRPASCRWPTSESARSRLFRTLGVHRVTVSPPVYPPFQAWIPGDRRRVRRCPAARRPARPRPPRRCLPRRPRPPNLQPAETQRHGAHARRTCRTRRDRGPARHR